MITFNNLLKTKGGPFYIIKTLIITLITLSIILAQTTV